VFEVSAEVLYRYNLFYPILVLTLINNLYQVCTHILTAVKFCGVDMPIVPGGAKDDQSILEFTIHNSLDFFGWISLFIVSQQLTFPTCILAGSHAGVGITAFFYPKVFSQYYIEDITKISNSLSSFQHFKIIFVLIDAAYRINFVVSILSSYL
jgi:hypothetical protein